MIAAVGVPADGRVRSLSFQHNDFDLDEFEELLGSRASRTWRR
jgi:hypothetical protein